MDEEGKTKDTLHEENIEPTNEEKKYLSYDDEPEEKETTPHIVQRSVKCGWNWGAFMFGWIYGIFNRSWICLVTLIPPIAEWLTGNYFPSWIALIFCIICGVVGERTSYENYMSSKEPFDIKKWKKHQHVWDVVGFIVTILWIVSLAFMCGLFLRLYTVGMGSWIALLA